MPTMRKRNTTITVDSFREQSFNLNFFIFPTLLIISSTKIVKNCDDCWFDMNIICRVPNMQNQTRKGFSYIELKKSDLARRPPLRVIDISKGKKGNTTVIIVANDSVKGQGGRSVRVKETNGVGKVPNDELTLNSDQHPDPHTTGTGSSTVGLGKIQNQTRKGFSYIELIKSDLARRPPLRVIDISKGKKGNTTVIIVANDSVKGQGGRSVRVKGTNGVGKGPNDELTLNSDQHPDPHTRGTGSSIVGFVKRQVLSGDDVDLAKGNDIGESWRNNFPPPLAGAGTKSKDDVGHEVDSFEANGNLDMGDGDKGDSKDEYYKQVEQRRALRTSAGSSSPEPVDGNHQIPYQMENIGSVEGRDGGATPDIDCDFDLTPHIGRTGGTTTVGIAFSQASNSVEGQEASSSGQNGGSGAGSGSDESDQSTGSGGTDTNEGISKRVGGDEHDEDNKDEGNDKDRNGVNELESGTGSLSNTRLVAIFTAIAVQSTSAIIALSLDGLSPIARKLFTCVLVTNLVGFLCLYVALFPSRYISPRAAEILVRVGGAAAAFGFLLMMGIKLSLGIIVPACVVILAASVLPFMP